MPHITHLIKAAMSDSSDPRPPDSLPDYEVSQHTMVGLLPLELRRVFVMLQKMTERSAPRELYARQALDKDLTLGHHTFHQNIAEFFALEPTDEVVICQHWYVCIKQGSSSVQNDESAAGLMATYTNHTPASAPIPCYDDFAAY